MTDEKDGMKFRDWTEGASTCVLLFLSLFPSSLTPHSDSKICSFVKRTEVMKLATIPNRGKLTIQLVRKGIEICTTVADGFIAARSVDLRWKWMEKSDVSRCASIDVSSSIALTLMMFVAQAHDLHQPIIAWKPRWRTHTVPSFLSSISFHWGAKCWRKHDHDRSTTRVQAVSDDRLTSDESIDPTQNYPCSSVVLFINWIVWSMSPNYSWVPKIFECLFILPSRWSSDLWIILQVLSNVC